MEMVKFEQQILNINNILPWTKVIGHNLSIQKQKVLKIIDILVL